MNLYLLLPICLVYALFLVSQGMIQNFKPYETARLVEPMTVDAPKKDAQGQAGEGREGQPGHGRTEVVETQTIVQGPMASQVAIKMLGTNGGGYMNANAAHPYENPTPLSNFIQMLLDLPHPERPDLLPWPDGEEPEARLGGLGRHGRPLPGAASSSAGGRRRRETPGCTRLGVDPAGGNMEGKEVRFGIFNSALFATVTTDASCGAVNSMHDSFTPLGGLVPLINMQLGEVVFGGVGAGLYGMLVFVILTVFLAGLMVGRTPEYLGKKIESYDVKVSALAVLILIFDILVFTAWAVVSGWGLAGLNNAGPHGFSEILYAYSSGTGNNGSAFAGLTANTPWYNTTLGFAMLIGRFFFIVPVLALAGNLAKKKIVPESGGSFPVSGVTFVLLLVGTVLIVGVLTFFPALGPGAHRRAFPDGPFQRRLLERKSSMAARKHSLFEPEILRQAAVASISEAEPAVADEKPRDVRHRSGGVPHDRLALLPSGERAAGVRPAGGRSGSGSRCCSPTSPRPWPRGGARRRPTRSARPVPRRWRTCFERTARWKPSLRNN